MSFQNIVVCGGGVLGSQIAFQLAFCELNVIVWVRSEESIKRTKLKISEIEKLYLKDLEIFTNNPKYYIYGIIGNKTNLTSEEIELYSDDTKVVFLFNKIRYVFYYSGDEITAYHTYVDYGDNATAKMAYSVIDREDETIKNCYVDGRYVVFEWEESEYEGLTYSNLRTVYSYMEELKK